MGINEEQYGWMDEGMAVFLPRDFQEKEGSYDPFYNVLRYYERLAGTEEELPPMIPTFQLRGWTENMATYYRPAFAYYFLQDAFGTELFIECLHEYINRWNGKHPLPYDFFFTFNEISGKDLSWYWKPWFFERGYPDIAIRDASFNNNIIEVTVERIGIIPTPVNLIIYCEDNSIVELYETAMIWENGISTAIIKSELNSRPVSVVLSLDIIPDTESSNNYLNFSTSTN
jgi:aminopeptidase N